MKEQVSGDEGRTEVKDINSDIVFYRGRGSSFLMRERVGRGLWGFGSFVDRNSRQRGNPSYDLILLK